MEVKEKCEGMEVNVYSPMEILGEKISDRDAGITHLHPAQAHESEQRSGTTLLAWYQCGENHGLGYLNLTA